MGVDIANKELPEEWVARVAKQAELVNAPRIGTDDNMLWGNVQMNVASAKMEEGMVAIYVSSSAPSLLMGIIFVFILDGDLSTLGFFGSAHIDQHDDPAAMTMMLSCGNVPEYYNMGTFHLIELGFFVTLSNKFSALAFSGLRLHGGNAPSCPVGQTWVNWATRLVFILYPASHLLNNSSITALGSIDGRLRNAEQEALVQLDEMRRRAGRPRDNVELPAADDDGDDLGYHPITIDKLEEKKFNVKYANMFKLPSSLKSKYIMPHCFSSCLT